MKRASGADLHARLQKYSTLAPSGCIEWTGALSKTGYGVLNVGGSAKKAHRLAYELIHGALPSEIFVCHTCDNPKCINTAHLFAGTSRENTLDCKEKGRMHLGEKTASARLNPSLVQEIRDASAKGETQSSIARRLNVSSGTVFKVVHRKTWAHLP